MDHSYFRLKAACYISNISMAVVGNLPPILFLTFREMYGISYSLLGLLVLINFVTQLTVDLIFSFFSHRFNLSKTVKFTPVLTVIGLLLYTLLPLFWQEQVYLCLVLGTVVFSASAGLVEVLLSPVIAAIPAENPDREMSKLHSIYAWGVVGVISVATVFLLLCGQERWQWLMLGMTAIPLASAILFCGTEIPPMETPEKACGIGKHLRNKALWVSVFAIFLGGAAECTMAQWASGYLEMSLGIQKVWGDLLGVAMFALMLGLGRTLYTKKGKHIEGILLLGAIGAAGCYLVAALTPFPVLGLFACGFTGLCVSMLWPGNLIAAAERIPAGGVFMYAMMAAGGDLGASVGPQLVGMLTDFAMGNPFMTNLARELQMTSEQLGMKLGILAGAVFPLLAIPVYWYIRRGRKTTDGCIKTIDATDG